MAEELKEGLRLVVGAGLRSLVPLLAERLAARRDPFERPFVCVPHREVQTWVRREIAERVGICMNVEHGALDDVLLEAARRVSDEPPLLWEPLSLAGAIRDELARGARARDWLDAEEESAELERRRLVVARQLAELFLDYDRTHPELLAAWERGDVAGEHPDAAWQAELWRRVRARAARRASAPSTVSELALVVRARRSRLSRPVHVIGFGHFAERERRALEALADITAVTVYLDALASEAEWSSAVGESPLARWGRPLRESLDGLRARAAVATIAPPCERATSTALERLRRCVMAPGSVTEAPPDDGSLVIAGAPGERREAEVVTHAVVASVVDDEGAGARRLSDVAVLLPRFAQQIAWLEDRFDALDGVPRSVPHGGRSARLFTLVEAMLALPSTSFERTFVLDVLLHPCFRGAELLAGAPGLCADAGIYLGADGSDGELAYLQGAPCFTWAQGLDRLLLSSLTDGVPELAVPAVADAPLPLIDLSAADEGALPLYAHASSLISDLRHLAAWRASAASWCQALESLLRTYVEPHDERDERALHSLLRTVERVALLAADDEETPPFTFPEVVAALESELATRGGGYGRALTDGVTVARMAVDRSIPRDVVIVTGLGEGLFPSRSRLVSWDVRSSSPGGWATGADLERLALLQAIFAAERRLVLTWVSKDPARDADLAPSPLLVELCTAWPALDEDIAQHPLKPYSDEYFGEQAEHRSFDRHAASTAAAMQMAVALENELRRDPARVGEPFDLPTWRRALPPDLARTAGIALPPSRTRQEREVARRMTLWTFRALLQEPAEGVAAESLRMKSWSLDADEESAVDHEPLRLEQSPLWSLVRKELAWTFLVEHAGEAPDEATIGAFVERELARLEQRGSVPVGRMRPGDLHAHVVTQLRSISAALDDAGAWQLEMCVPVVGSSSERLPLRRHRPAVRLACGARPIEITHQRSALFRGDDKAVLLGFSGSTSPKPGADPDFRLRLELLILLLAGFVDERSTVDTLFVYGDEKARTTTGRFRLPTRQEAEDYLAQLAAKVEDGMPSYRLPSDAFVALLPALIGDDDDARAAAHEAVTWDIADAWPRRDDDDRWRRTAALRDHDGLRLPTVDELHDAATSRFRLLLDMEVGE